MIKSIRKLSTFALTQFPDQALLLGACVSPHHHLYSVSDVPKSHGEVPGSTDTSNGPTDGRRKNEENWANSGETSNSSLVRSGDTVADTLVVALLIYAPSITAWGYL